MMTPRNKAIRLVNQFGLEAAFKIAHEMTNTLGWMALMAATKEMSDDYKNERFYWDTVKEIIQKERDGIGKDL
jgi:hypothetical protein